MITICPVSLLTKENGAWVYCNPGLITGITVFGLLKLGHTEGDSGKSCCIISCLRDVKSWSKSAGNATPIIATRQIVCPEAYSSTNLFKCIRRTGDNY